MKLNPNEAPMGYIAALSFRGSCDCCAFKGTQECDDAPCLWEDRNDKCEVYFVEAGKVKSPSPEATFAAWFAEKYNHDDSIEESCRKAWNAGRRSRDLP